MEKDVIYRQTKNVGRLSVTRTLKKDGTQVFSIDDDKEEQFIDLTLDKDVKSFEESCSFKFILSSGDKVSISYANNPYDHISIGVNNNPFFNIPAPENENFESIVMILQDTFNAHRKLLGKNDIQYDDNVFIPKKPPILPKEPSIDDIKSNWRPGGALKELDNEINKSSTELPEHLFDRIYWHSPFKESELTDMVMGEQGKQAESDS